MNWSLQVRRGRKSWVSGGWWYMVKGSQSWLETFWRLTIGEKYWRELLLEVYVMLEGPNIGETYWNGQAHIFWHSIWHTLTFCLAFFLAYTLTFCLTVCLALASGHMKLSCLGKSLNSGQAPPVQFHVQTFKATVFRRTLPGMLGTWHKNDFHAGSVVLIPFFLFHMHVHGVVQNKQAMPCFHRKPKIPFKNQCS